VFNGSSITAEAVSSGAKTKEPGVSRLPKTVADNPRNPCVSSMRLATRDINARRIAATLDYMRRHLNETLEIEVLSRVAGVSPSHFFHLFKRATGHAPVDYFIRIRMDRAGELLKWSTLTIKEIADVMGYSDAFYFSRVFKSVQGVAPREYRSVKRMQRIRSRPFVPLLMRDPEPQELYFPATASK
jgi:AraC-like DNA-binding protein